ncbi:hypothetical protein PGT21_032245 [Puccinia graminis f. sp. tritici]|uniref:Uncharacterized protein n=1 Tax=Puccinia graminis f. sp. tritici TaxID=56615 RepID=A0A5B0P515_PUCGR|nr:hypothetical protein PGT21_032245 [Puccinia graminis f. sp. tritici]KAA1095620.1 hypothetical protein PGTUg99_011185 [Puccinia graminis f. sp. tritici]
MRITHHSTLRRCKSKYKVKLASDALVTTRKNVSPLTLARSTGSSYVKEMRLCPPAPGLGEPLRLLSGVGMDYQAAFSSYVSSNVLPPLFRRKGESEGTGPEQGEWRRSGAKAGGEKDQDDII